VTRIDFNFRKNLIDSMIHISTCRFPVLVETAVNTIQRVFKQDRQGDATVDVMSSISKVAKTKGHRISPLLLDAFLDIKVSKDLLQSLADEKSKAAKMDRKLLSYKERKHKKELAKVEKDLQSNQLEENKKLKGRLHSQIIQSVFAIFFRILRREDDKVRMRLLPSVLKGVAKFVHFIGVEYMDDLVKTLNSIVECPESKSLEKLLCVRTVFSILSGDGSALNIDPYKFYEHLFKVSSAEIRT
jgi:nucleolar complex protein 3